MSRWKLGFAPAVVAILTAAAVAGCGSNSSGGTSSSSGGASASSSKKTYDIYLSNSYLGEGWRTQMVKSA
jgi:ABC-type sugar transport system substrate-binding protein